MDEDKKGGEMIMEMEEREKKTSKILKKFIEFKEERIETNYNRTVVVVEQEKLEGGEWVTVGKALEYTKDGEKVVREVGTIARIVDRNTNLKLGYRTRTDNVLINGDWALEVVKRICKYLENYYRKKGLAEVLYTGKVEKDGIYEELSYNICESLGFFKIEHIYTKDGRRYRDVVSFTGLEDSDEFVEFVWWW